MPAAPPEERLLLLSARTHLPPGGPEQLAALCRGPLDWPRVVRLARRNGVAALLYRHVTAACPDAVPADALDTLRAVCRATAANNLLLAGELHRILARLTASGVDAIAWKGPVLAVQAYGDLALRGFNDLDLLVRPADLPRARAAVEAAGYQPVHPLTPSQARAVRRTFHEEQFTRDGQLVELHWRIATDVHRVPFDFDGFWDRQTTVTIGRRPVPSLSPSDLLLTLCAHGSSHAWHRLLWVCDVAEFVRRVPGVDWGRVLGESERGGWGRIVRVALALAWGLLDAPLPPEARAAVERDRAVPRLVARVRPQFVGEDKGAGLVLPFHLGVRERLRDKAALLGRAAFTPAPDDWSLLALPDRAYPLYYLLRPLRLLGHYGLALARGRD